MADRDREALERLLYEAWMAGFDRAVDHEDDTPELSAQRYAERRAALASDGAQESPCKRCGGSGEEPEPAAWHLGFPVGDMVERGWMSVEDLTDREEVEAALCRFFDVDSVAGLPLQEADDDK